jgi:hypothetical protein
MADVTKRAVALTQVQKLAKYAARASFDDLSAESLTQLPVHILDCLACCISALGAAPVNACREQVADFGGTGPCELIGGGKANPIYAGFWHTALVRYVDFMDNFLAKTCRSRHLHDARLRSHNAARVLAWCCWRLAARIARGSNCERDRHGSRQPC